MTIGEKIRYLRSKNNLSQDALAKALHTTKQAIYKYENGIVTNIPLDKINVLANVLNTTPAYLMGWEEKENPPAEPQLTEGEEKLLKLIRLMPEEMKKQYTELLESTLKALGLIQ